MMKYIVTALILFLSLPLQAVEPSNKEIKVYRSPNCNCCHKWISHLEQHKFTVIDILTHDMANVKDTVKLPRKLSSCHTAIIDGYIIEGHVPATDIERLIAEKPDITGLSVPNMPVGTPGMEMGNRKDDYNVFAFSPNDKISIFQQYLHQQTEHHH